MLFSIVQVNDTLKEAFASFRQDPLNAFKVTVRRTRAAQLRQLLSHPESIDLATFQYEVWNIENKTHLGGHNIDLLIFDENRSFLSIEYLLDHGQITLLDLEAALVTVNAIMIEGHTLPEK